MANIYIDRAKDSDKFVVRVVRGLRGAKFHHFDSRDEAEKFAQDNVGTGSIHSTLDMTDAEIEAREQALQKAYNG